MKLQFKNQQFQTDAVNAVCNLFRGQEKRYETFTIVQEDQFALFETGLGIGNVLTIENDAINQNMHEVQKTGKLPLTTLAGESAEGEMGGASRSFCIEMETGTGKTYVYTKTIFELHRQYGFTKFIVVVPSVAIREGVYKSFQITEEHFKAQYDNAPYRYFIYDSKKLSAVRDFAVGSDIEIMIINIDAFKKSENVINQAQDKLNGETAMRYIQDCNPIVIIDEPQSVDNTPKAKEAIASLNPLCVLRYSATHREKINLLYRLTPVDAYQMGIVKQICVAGSQASNDFNKPYIRLVSVSNDNSFSAKIEIDKADKKGAVTRKTIIVKPGAELYTVSGDRDIYEGYVIDGIDCAPGFEVIDFTNGERLNLGQSMGDIDENIIKKAQIRRTIEAHFDKELRYYDKGIKVLSLFFIDEVAKYRREDGTPGIYAEMFEECYSELIAMPKYAGLKDRFAPNCHNGYFSQDKKGHYKNTKGDTLDDYDTYNTIMKDKEWLLSFDCPLRFIFSHSTLKEGWDNPNVFQVCTLIEQKSTFTCRQKIGRGLRLCVNQNGERIEDKNINVLHVMANEGFAEFAETLQKEIETETGVKFGVLQLSMFVGQTYEEKQIIEKAVTAEQAAQVVETLKASGMIDDRGKVVSDMKSEEVKLWAVPEAVKAEVVKIIEKAEPIAIETLSGRPYTETVVEEKTFSYDDAAVLMAHLEEKKLVTKDGKIRDTMKAQLAAGTLDLGSRFSGAAQKAIVQTINKSNTSVPVRNYDKEVKVHLNKQVLLSPEFMALWDKIKQKTVYRVKIDEEQLKERCIHELSEIPAIPKARVITKTADLHIEHSGITHTETGLRTANIEDVAIHLPDLLRVIDNECFLPQRIVIEILFKSGRAQDFLNNPQLFMEQFIDILHHIQYNMEIDGISYMRLEGEEYYLQEIFDSEELTANLDRNAVAVEHSVYDYVMYDSSTIEKPFAVALDNDPDVKMFFKIPDKFKIETPIGTYNPDWAVYIEKNGAEKLYFVLETKGTLRLDDLRGSEQQKIHCGKRHFAALETEVEYELATNWGQYREKQV